MYEHTWTHATSSGKNYFKKRRSEKLEKIMEEKFNK